MMKSNIKDFLYSLLISLCVICQIDYGFAQTAALLPMAVQQFFDNNGNPLSSGTVTTYIAGTSTLKTTWKDSLEAVPNTNPIVLDGGGKAIIYGQGTYRQVVKDRLGNLIWDAVTAPGGSGGSSVQTGDGDLVGTVKPWAGIVAPNQYVFAAGQELIRVNFPDLLTAITQTLNVNCTSGSAILTGLADTTSISVGSRIEVSCVAPTTTVVSKTASTVTLSVVSSVTLSSPAVFFPFGNGNTTTTFNVPDLRDQVIVGRPNMGGTDRGLINSTNYGLDPTGQGAIGGNQQTTLASGNIPSVLGTVKYNQTAVQSGTGTTVTTNIDNTGAVTSNSAVTTNAGLTAISRIQPSISLNYIIKTTPDTNSAIATGVLSLGGMTGVIACGSGLLCTGNIISITGATVNAGTPNSLAYYSGANAISSNANLNISVGALTIGVLNTTIGQILLTGNISGTATITPQAAAGTPTITLGTSSGTPAVTASSPLVITTATGNIACVTCVTSSGGGAIIGVAPVAVSAAGAVSITGAAGQILAGAGPAFTATPTLGASGTLGSITFGNASSGLLTLQAVTGALGTVTVSLPAATDTLVGKATTDTFTNKTYDTAGTGNSFLINGLAATANTGTGAVARATSPTFITPTLGAATGTSLGIGGAAPATGIEVFNAAVSPSGNGQLILGADSTNGGTISGQGSTFDIRIRNKTPSDVCNVATGTLTWNCSAISIGGSTIGIGANPTALVGLTAVNGSATNYIRSDGAPAIDQSIAPTWTGAHIHSNTVTISSTSLIFSGNISQTAWTTNGLRIKGVAATFTDTSSSGTVATAYTDVLGGNTIAASSSTTFTNYFTAYIKDPVQGTNVTLTNKWAIGGDSAKIGTSNQFAISNAGHITVEGVTSTGATGTGKFVFDGTPTLVTPVLGAATATSINGLIITSTAGTLTIANNVSASLITSGNFALTLTATATTNSTFPAGTHTLASIDLAQTWTAIQTFTNSDIKLLGSSTGATTFTSANAGASNFTLTFPAITATLTTTIASGAKALATGAIASAACTTAQTDTATGALTTDAVIVSFSADPTAVTGYVPLTSGMLTIIYYPTADTVNFKVCNNTTASITPGAVTINWRVVR